MPSLAQRRIQQLSAERDSRLHRAYALQVRGLPVSARQQMAAALVAQHKLQQLTTLMARRAATATPQGFPESSSPSAPDAVQPPSPTD